MLNRFIADETKGQKWITEPSLNSIWCLSSLKRLFLIGHQREWDQDKWMCREINWFPSLVCAGEELQQQEEKDEEEAGTQMEDWTVGEEINWSHYVAEISGLEAGSQSSVCTWSQKPGSVKWLQLLKIPGQSTKQPEPSDNSLPLSLRRHRSSSTAVDEYNAVLPHGLLATELNVFPVSIPTPLYILTTDASFSTHHMCYTLWQILMDINFRFLECLSCLAPQC